jgi:plastocyanin domain-containing protein
MVIWMVAFLLVELSIAVLVVILAMERRRSQGRHARRLADGTQEARVVVDGGYRPSRIDLDVGVPTTLRFERRENDPCTELLVSDLWPSAHRLVANGETEVRFTPQRVGRYAFTCGMGVYSGELLVHGGRAS